MATTLHTCHPGVEEDVDVSAVVPFGPSDAVWRHHSNIHVVLSHNAVGCRSDAHGDYVV